MITYKQLAKALAQSKDGAPLDEETIDAFTNENLTVDSAGSARLHEDLARLVNQPLSIGLATGLVKLAPYLVQSEHLRFWFQTVVPYAVDSGGHNANLVVLCTKFVSSVLRAECYVENAQQQANENSTRYLNWLLEIYTHKETPFLPKNAADNDERRRFIRFSVRKLIQAYGKKHIHELMAALNGLVIVPTYRLDALQLFSETLSCGETAKLFRATESPLFESLLVCLERDSLSDVLTVAARTLAMLMPHICDKLTPLLPRLYAIFGRLCSWRTTDEIDHEPSDSESLSPKTTTILETKDIQASKEKKGKKGKKGKKEKTVEVWAPLEALPRQRPPQPDALFTFLYGLFPNNTLAFGREPSLYLEHYRRPFKDFWDRHEIIRKINDLVPHYTLHPLLFTSNSALETSSNSRWQNYRGVSAIVQECLDLRVATYEPDTGTENSTDYDYTKLINENHDLFLTALSQKATRGSQSQDSPTHTSPALSPRTTLTPSDACGIMSPKSLNATMLTTASPRKGRAATLDKPLIDTVRSSSQPPEEPSDLNADVVVQRKYSVIDPKTSARPASNPTLFPDITAPSPILEPETTPLQYTSNPPGKQVQVGLSTQQYFIRELLLLRNELDFANFSKRNVDRKLVYMQKRLSELDITKIRLEYLARKNKQLNAQLKVLEDLNSKAQKAARTYLNQRTSYETSLVEKIKDYRAQIETKNREILFIRDSVSRLEIERGMLESLAHEREARVLSLEQKLIEKSSITQDKTTSSENQEPEGDDFELKYIQSQQELQSLQQEQHTALEEAHAELQRLRLLIHQSERDEVRYPATKEFEDLQKSMNHIQEDEREKHLRLRESHEELLVKYTDLERELRARQIHEEERMNELRLALSTSRPFTMNENEQRVKGRGGVQRTLKRV